MATVRERIQIPSGTTKEILVKKTAKIGVNGPGHGTDLPANPGPTEWQYGWTHYGVKGQTAARFHRRTREVEVKDGAEWIRCAPGADGFFTPTSHGG